MAGSSKKKITARRPVRRRPDNGSGLVPRLLLLSAAVLLVFEGGTIKRLLTHKVGSDIAVTSGTQAGSPAGGTASDAGSTSSAGTSSGGTSSGGASSGGTSSDGSGSSSGGASSGGTSSDGTASAGGSASSGGDSTSDTLAGLGIFDTLIGGSSSAQTETTVTTEAAVSEQLDSRAVVTEQAASVDDSYFSDAVFIGDSRMEGFRNSSGITQGTFLTAVGLQLSDMSSQIISSVSGKISVYQGLSGEKYGKIYLMLGANDLGYYPMSDFRDNFASVIRQFHELQENAIIYICSVIYVDESKISSEFSYDNNENVNTLNAYMLEVCEELPYAWYINLNEIFSNGYGSLLSDASSDGIHLYPKYCEMMLDYLKSHYITESEADAAEADADDAENADADAADEEADAEDDGAADDDASGGSNDGSDLAPAV